MDFHENNAIYLQIASLLRERILKNVWAEEQRVPAVREMAVELVVNPNTVLRAYMLLEANNIIHNKRGIGYFVSAGAPERIVAMRKQEFVENELPRFFQSMELLDIDMEEIQKRFRLYAKLAKTGATGKGVSHEAK